MSDFFRINMPYGMAKNKEGKWMFFNREYMPLGLMKNNLSMDDKFVDENNERYYIRYKGISEKLLMEVMENYGGKEHCDRNEQGEIVRLWFYCDATTPAKEKIDSKLWEVYTQKLKKLYCFISY